MCVMVLSKVGGWRGRARRRRSRTRFEMVCLMMGMMVLFGDV